MEDGIANVLAAAIRENTTAIKKMAEVLDGLSDTIQTNSAHLQDTQSKLMLLVTVLEKEI